MSLLEETLVWQQAKRFCKVCSWLEDQDADHKTEWSSVFSNPMIQTRSIQQVMKKRGFGVSYSTVQRHRNERHES